MLGECRVLSTLFELFHTRVSEIAMTLSSEQPPSDSLPAVCVALARLPLAHPLQAQLAPSTLAFSTPLEPIVIDDDDVSLRYCVHLVVFLRGLTYFFRKKLRGFLRVPRIPYGFHPVWTVTLPSERA